MAENGPSKNLDRENENGPIPVLRSDRAKKSRTEEQSEETESIYLLRLYNGFNCNL